MHKNANLFYLLIVFIGCKWMILQTVECVNSFIRKINILQSGQYWWIVEFYQNQVFVVDRAGNKVDQTIIPGSRPSLPFYVVRIDPKTERIVEEFTTKHFRGVAISAEREQRPDSWLAQDYDYWVLDEQSDIAYALKPVRWDEWNPEKRYEGVYVIDLKTRQVRSFLGIPNIFTLVLHPNEKKLYIMTAPKEAEMETGEIRVYSTTNWGLLKTISYTGGAYIWDAEFTQDGSRLFCCVHGRGILVINTVSDELESWEPPPDFPICFGIKDRIVVSLALSSDERELYIALRIGRERGAVAAIDIAQKKLVRTLELSPTACTSVAVIGDKLFAACLDGVYVIDIPAWRQQ